MIRLGLLTFSDVRESAHKDQLSMTKEKLNEVVKALEAREDIEIIKGDILHTAEQANKEAKRMRDMDVDGTILNFPIWCFPNLATIVANHGKPPYLLLASENPKAPGLIAMLASAGSLDQLGINHQRLWGNIEDSELVDEIVKFGRACSVVNNLKGQQACVFGGRSMGQNVGQVDPVQWQKVFGVDLKHMGQGQIIERAKEISEERVNSALSWLEEKIGQINYNDDSFTRETLGRQVRSYLAMKDIIEEENIDFHAVKCQPYPSDGYATLCIAHAFLNDPYDMEGEKEINVSGCEADLDGALTMQILHLLTGDPVLFYDLRHYDTEEEIYVFSNCGSMSTYYAGGSDNPDDNLKNVTLDPQTAFFFPAGGAAVRYMCEPAEEVTFARLGRKEGKYWMIIFTGEFKRYPEEKLQETSPNWPQGFTEVNIGADELISRSPGNHFHSVYGNYVDELVSICEMLGIGYEVLTD